MSESTFTIPRLGWEIPKPVFWDWIAIAIALLSAALAVWGLMSASSLAAGGDLSPFLIGLWTLLQLAIAVASLLVLGKTAKEGTIHGNIAAVIGSLLGLNGIFLAAALAAIA